MKAIIPVNATYEECGLVSQISSMMLNQMTWFQWHISNRSDRMYFQKTKALARQRMGLST